MTGRRLHLSFQIWALLAVAAAILVILVLAAINVFGRVAQRRLGAPTLSLPVHEDQTELDRAIAPLLTRHPGESGLMLMTSGLAAFRARLETARLAGRSLDLQYYFWKGDLTGQLLIHEVAAAAERGVRVRLLLDDINSFGFDPSLLALDSHPNIAVRLFNPSRSRTDTFRRGLELVFKYFTATRRMHNKCWLADGRVAAFVAGMGAALADTLFGAVAAFGIGAVMTLIDGQIVPIKVVGGLFMIGLGIHTWRSAAIGIEAAAEGGPGMGRDFLSTVIITITKPATILGVAGVCAAWGPSGRPGGAQSGLLVAGIFCGSTLWWLVLSALASAARSRVTPQRMRLFNHVSGAMLAAFGLAALVSLIAV